MKTKTILTAALALLVITASVVSIAHIHRLSARVKALENARNLQLARAKVLIRAFERSPNHKEMLESAKLIVAVFEPDPRAAAGDTGLQIRALLTRRRRSPQRWYA